MRGEVEQRRMSGRRRHQQRLVGHADIIEAGMAERRPGVAADEQREDRPRPQAAGRQQAAEQVPAPRKVEDDADIGDERACGEPRFGRRQHHCGHAGLKTAGIGVQHQRVVARLRLRADDERIAQRPEDCPDHTGDSGQPQPSQAHAVGREIRRARVGHAVGRDAAWRSRRRGDRRRPWASERSLRGALAAERRSSRS